MKTGRMFLAFIAMLTVFMSASFAAPKIDPELSARLKAIESNAQLGVILTFQGTRITNSQLAAVQALGITTGVRMVNFPIMAVNATPAQIQRCWWTELRSVYRKVVRFTASDRR